MAITSRWPEPVRDPLPVGQVTLADIDEMLQVTTRYLRDPEDPAFDQVTWGLLLAVRGGLIACAEVLDHARIGEEMAAERGEEPHHHRWMRIGEMYAAQKAARRLIDELRQWIPEHPPRAGENEE